MKFQYNKETPKFGAEPLATPYQKAKQEWDERIGNSRVQARNWRLVALIALLLSLVLALLLSVCLLTRKNALFIAEVSSGGRVVNIAPLKEAYRPNEAQIEYFLGQFINMLFTVPLDPVVAKNNWSKAYDFVMPRAATQLNKYLQQRNPLNLLGKKTVTVNIIDSHPISDKVYAISWTETITDNSGQQESELAYSGVFTITEKSPASQDEIFRNPLGIYIVDLNITLQEKSYAATN